ncbi:MAG TPA: glycoside hydrolase family 2 TIM barrel-domain containing protein [Verrucomicrobiae bacterium]|nr:glycoside hydrolase family 2 TIM barrel-domain containing protein [Verrucomicrobiae bacterium]
MKETRHRSLFTACVIVLSWWSVSRCGPVANADQYTPPTSNRSDFTLNDSWKFNRADVVGAQNPGFDDSAWTAITLPHTWNNLDGQDGPSTAYYRGIGWYRRHYTVDGSYTNRQLFLKFDGANIVADVYVNGTFIGEHQGGFSAFVFDVTSNVNVGADNVIAVKVNNALNADIPPLDADFTFFGGIYRTVHLLVLDKLHVTPLDYGSPGVYLKQTSVSNTSATLQVTAKLRNDTGGDSNVTVTAVIVDGTNNVVATLTTNQMLTAGSDLAIAQTTTIANPHLWNGRADPYLYQVYVQVNDGTTTNDLVQQPLGFRYYSVDINTGFHLNGQYLDLHGVNFHQDRLNEGWAISEADMTQDVSFVVEMGCTAVRLGHYQHPQTEYNLLDQGGIVVWSEIPLIDYITSSVNFSNNASQQLIETIRQNYNHPSICFWGIYNEILLDGGPDPRPLVQALNQLAKAEDPTRLTTAASCCADNYDPINFYTDVIGFNEYYGWYTGAYTDFGGAMDTKFTTVSKPMGISEYGAGASIYQHMENPSEPANPSSAGSPHYEEYENLLHESTWQQMAARPYLWLKTVWNMFDFASDARNEGDTPGRNDKGLVTYDRQTRKDAFYWYKANWTTNGFVYISSRRFTPRATTVVEVKAYSNCDSVQLQINGVSQGTLTSTNHIFKWTGRTLGNGTNTLVAIGTQSSQTYTDTVIWVLANAVNSGGGPVGQFAADAYFSGGASSSSGNTIDTSTVTNPAPQGVYQTSRFGNFTYTFPGLALASNYLVRLHFADYYWTTTNQRLFNVSINGVQVLSNFDIIAAAGAANRANIQEFLASPDNSGQVTIQYTTLKDNALSSGLEMIPNGLVSNRPPVIVVNSPVGAAATLNNTNSALVLNTTVTDDGFPEPSTLTMWWTQIAGPAGVIFGSSNAPVTTATFPQSGAYILQLTASDGQLQTIQNVNITVDPTTVYGAGLTAYWKFDETSGTTASDSSGNGLNATASSASLWTPNGYLNGAVNINNVGANNVNAGHPTALNNLFSTGATVCAYINTASLGGSSLGRIMDKSATGWIFYNQNSLVSGQYQVQFEQAFSNNRVNKWQTGHVITTGTWTHVAVSYSSNSQTNIPRIYVNGVAQTITDVSTGSANPSETPLDDSASSLFIGNRADAARPFGGRIDDVRIYSRALTPAEVFGLAMLPTGNRAPSVSAGASQTAVIGAPIALNGTATDDGLPNPPGAVTTIWSQVSGPGSVTFGNANAANSPATFDTAGVYVLRLIANDGQSQAASDMSVTVYATSYDAWAASHGLTGSAALSNADPDGDGQDNLAEFLAGTDPTNGASAFRITSIVRQGNDFRITWMMGPGKTNALQWTAGAGDGSYNTNTFIDLFNVTNTVGTTTNYLDPGGATNFPSRYYRVRLVP